MLKFAMFSLRLMSWGTFALSVLYVYYLLTVSTYGHFTDDYDVEIFVVAAAYLFYCAIVFTICPSKNDTPSGVRVVIYIGWVLYFLFALLALASGEFQSDEIAPVIAIGIILLVVFEILMYPVRLFAGYYFKKYPK